MPTELGHAGTSLPLIRKDEISLRVPDGWEASIRRRTETGDGQHLPMLHAATVPLPDERGDYGSGVVETLGATDVFISLVEFGPEAVGTALFPVVETFPVAIDAAEFRTNQLQRAIPGQAGKQVFFSYRDRAFCLYVVLGSFALREGLAGRATEIIAGVEVEPSGGS
jgi:hypothetical protein